MSGHGTTRARALAAELLTACSPGSAGADLPVTPTFRCWTPLRDWEHGRAGVAALREVILAYCARTGRAAGFQADALITDGASIVVEASAPQERGRLPVSITVLLVVRSGLVDEARCYIDPRTIGTQEY